MSDSKLSISGALEKACNFLLQAAAVEKRLRRRPERLFLICEILFAPAIEGHPAGTDSLYFLPVIVSPKSIRLNQMLYKIRFLMTG